MLVRTALILVKHGGCFMAVIFTREVCSIHLAHHQEGSLLNNKVVLWQDCISRIVCSTHCHTHPGAGGTQRREPLESGTPRRLMDFFQAVATSGAVSSMVSGDRRRRTSSGMRWAVCGASS
jgi:hypothetical protein